MLDGTEVLVEKSFFLDAGFWMLVAMAHLTKSHGVVQT
jgi:hypothetical protein